MMLFLVTAAGFHTFRHEYLKHFPGSSIYCQQPLFICCVFDILHPFLCLVFPSILNKTNLASRSPDGGAKVWTEGDQPWDFSGRNDAEAETPVLWPPHAKN